VCGVVGVSLAPGPVSAGSGAHRLAGLAVRDLLHRGPDGHGVAGDDDSAVGMCRLRVRSAPSDRVPFQSELGSAAFAYNGEVYLVGNGTRDGGTGVVPAGGLAEGEAVGRHGPQQLDGMYALARRDRDGAIEVVRDPLGIKPLYLRRHRDGVAVASELAALEPLFGRPRIRRAALAQYLLLGRVVDGGTFYEDIEPVPPGARLQLKQGAATVLAVQRARPYRGLGDRREPTTAALRDAVTRAVERVLVTDRPLGLAVSGGLDSTVLATELARLGLRDLATVSVVPRDTGDGVRDLRELGLPGRAWRSWQHRWVRFGPGDLLDGCADAVASLGEPTALTSVPMYAALARLAAESGIVVLLVGEGSDELFGGYRSYLGVPGLSDPREFYLSPRRDALVRQLLGEDLFRDARAALDAALPAGNDPASVVREFEYEHSLEPLLRRADHLLMAQGVEGRVPYLHGGLPALAAALPFSRIVHNGQTKVPLRQAYAEELPQYRGEVKKPFRAPVASWLTGPHRARLLGELTGHRDRLVAAGLRPEGVGALCAGVADGDATATGLAFATLTLGIWLAADRMKSTTSVSGGEGDPDS
jgi:asparagine synthase (glutamine-hydrolysing)